MNVNSKIDVSALGLQCDLHNNLRMDVKWIKNQLELTGKKQVELARHLGWDPSAVSRMLHRAREIKVRDADRIREFFEGKAPVPGGDSPRPAVDADAMPVYRSAQGGDEGAMIFSWDPVEYIERPEPLGRTEKGFGIYVVGDSMEPVYRAGDMLLIHPNRPPRTGSRILLILKSDDNVHAAMVKEMVAVGAESVTVRQYNPKRDFKVPRNTVDGLYEVVGVHYSR